MAISRSITTPIPFDPDLGGEASIYRRLVRAAAKGREAVTAQIVKELETAEGAAARFSLSVLHDIASVGGNVWVRDSRLFVSWPDWEGPYGRANARRALEMARDLEGVSNVDFVRLRPLFLGDAAVRDLVRLAREGEFELVSAHEKHPSGLSYMEGFSAALRYWSMPYRGRTGRMIRYVLTVRHFELAPDPKIVGILELGDEAPFCSWRDDLIGLSPRATEDWFLEGNPNRALIAAERLRRIRSTLRPLDSGIDFATLPAIDVVRRQSEVEALAAGRSTVQDHQLDVLFDRRRAIYALRLALGEYALSEISSGAKYSEKLRKQLLHGARALRDLLVPRLHMEVTVCGALPPFSEVLGGKLVVSQFAHPSVIEAVSTPLGELIGRTFYSEVLAEEISSPGMIAITTKGLYAGHSPLYNRSSVPALTEPLVIKRIAETAGQSSTLMSRATADAAREYLAASEKGEDRKVSNIYGSGGAKRHRILEVAARQAGLSADMVNAGIRRPVYGVAFVGNSAQVAWEGAAPDWSINRREAATEYVHRAVDLWRRRWLVKAGSRLVGKDVVPGLITEVIRSRQNQQTNVESLLRESSTGT